MSIAFVKTARIFPRPGGHRSGRSPVSGCCRHAAGYL